MVYKFLALIVCYYASQHSFFVVGLSFSYYNIAIAYLNCQ
jgi:hypothetical protein